MRFHIGQRVVCVKGDEFWSHGWSAYNFAQLKTNGWVPVMGQQYTIMGYNTQHAPRVFVIIKELSQGYLEEGFAPITDISVLEKLLKREPVREDA